MKIHPNKPAQSHIPASHGGKYGTKNPDANVIDFSSNVNPLGCHPGVKRYLKKQLNLISEYPDPNSTNLRANLAWFTGVPKKQIVVGNGATEIIYNFCKTFLNKKTHVLIPIPTFSEYEVSAKLCEAKISFFKTMNLTKNLQKFIMKIPRNGCVFICNPNNPTGIVVNSDAIRALLDEIPVDIPVLIDEAYHHYIQDPAYATSVPYVAEGRPVLVARTFSKIYGMAGMRLGYGIAPADMIEHMRTYTTGSVNALVKWGGAAALADTEYERWVKDTTIRLRERTITAVRDMGFNVLPSETNFFMVHTGRPAAEVRAEFRKRGIMVGRDFPPMLDHLRVSISTEEDMDRFLEVWKEIFPEGVAAGG